MFPLKNIIKRKIIPKIMIPSKKVNNKENEITKENEGKNVKTFSGFSHSENLKKTIENKLNEMKNYETVDVNQAKKQDLEEKLKN